MGFALRLALVALAAIGFGVHGAPAHGSADGVTASPLATEIDRLAAAIEPEVVAWRHLHEHPELSNREVETAKYIAERLRSFGLEPQTGIARTGVVAVLKGAKPGPVVALRADMDALPVREEVDLPFASKAMGEYDGQKVSVMHACGRDRRWIA
jgi:metal-dependent amidase/aminoacylase/carboxypeptidase family protein